MLKLVVGSVGPLLSDVASNLHRAGREHQMLNDVMTNPHPGFVGSMQQFVYNGNHYFDMALDENVENIEVTARFDNREAILHNPVTFESRDLYVGLTHQLLKTNNMHFTLSFKFKTLQQSGLILFSGLAGHDFLALELYKGFLYYIYDMGAGSKRIHVSTPEPLNDNQWHEISLFRPLLDQQLICVDNYSPTVEDMKDSAARHFDLTGPLYVGGVIKTRYNLLPMKVMSRFGYLGCMASFEINGERINIIDAANEFNDTNGNSVISGCTSSQNMCHTLSCYHGGRCEQQWNSYACNCDMTSYMGPTCSAASVAYRFGFDNGLIVFEYPEDGRPSTKNDYLAFGITTTQNTAKLVRIDSADSDDYIEMELAQGNIFMVYNMGQGDIPLVTLQQKVNDGKYHVIKFIRSEANASLQVDYEVMHKIPVGTTMSVFNTQARVWLGGRKDSKGSITQEFHGTISGFYFNGLHILDLLQDGDPRVRAEGDVTLVETTQQTTPPAEVIIPDRDGEMQSTQGIQKRNRKRSALIENSARHSQTWTSSNKSSRNIHNRKNAIKQTFIPKDSSLENTISKGKSKRMSGNYTVVGNSAKRLHFHESFTSAPPDHVTVHNSNDYMIGGIIKSIYSSGNYGIDDNIHTDEEHSGSSMTLDDDILMDGNNGVKDVTGDSSNIKLKLKINRFSQLFHHRLDNNNQKDVQSVSIKALERAPFAIDDRFKSSHFPKDRGKQQSINKNNKSHSNRKHSKEPLHSSSTTKDDIISSGEGPDCYNDDEDECISMPSVDDIIAPTIIVTKLATPQPDPHKNNQSAACKDCSPIGKELVSTVNTSDTYSNQNNMNSSGQSTPSLGANEAKNTNDSGHLNIFLIIGIAAGVLVALIIIGIALYKFCSRDEGSYRVDESQNFAYLEAKKLQTNGSAVTAIGSGGKTSCKKKDVKEWYV